MNENTTKKDWVVKILVIIGFIATIWLILWAGGLAIQKLSPTFANLASVAEFKDDYKPEDKLEIEVEKEVVNSGESFEIHWTDMKQAGEFKFTYECEDGVTMLIRGDRGQLLPMDCTDTFTLPATVHGLFLSIDSITSRFIDVDFEIAFISNQKEIVHAADAKITVVNASVPVGQEVAGESTGSESENEEETQEETNTDDQPSTQTPVTPQQPTYTTIYPESNPSGNIDLKMSILGTGEIRNGVFRFTDTLDPYDRNAVKFDVHNIGSKTSGTWRFEITLPDGTKYRSDTQSALKPKEHAEMVLQFNVDDDELDDDFVEIEIEVETNNDTRSSNDSAVWSIPVED